MIRRLRHHDNGFQTELNNNPRRDRRSRNEDDNLAVARCPICGAPMVARVDCRGPYFFCLCGRPRRRAA